MPDQVGSAINGATPSRLKIKFCSQVNKLKSMLNVSPLKKLVKRMAFPYFNYKLYRILDFVTISEK